MEADLEGLSGAYNSLETHSFALEARLRQLESAASTGAQRSAAPDAAADTSAADENEDDGGLNDLLICLGQASALCLQTPRLTLSHCSPQGKAGIADAAHPSQLTAFIGCLLQVGAGVFGLSRPFGKQAPTDLQEEQKVERLRLKLKELGVDVDGLLEGIGNDDEDNDGDTDGKD